MLLKDSADKLAVRLRETVEQFSQQELGRAYSHEDFVQQASVSLDLVASECLMFGADVFDEVEEAQASQPENVVVLDGGRRNRVAGEGCAGPSERAAAEIVADYRARWAVSRLKVARTTIPSVLQSYPMLAAIIMVVAAVVIDSAFRGSMSHSAMVLVLSLAVGLSGLVAGMAGVLCAATLAITCNYVFLQPVFDWPTGCTAKYTMHLVLVATAAGLFIKRRELKLLFARRVPA